MHDLKFALRAFVRTPGASGLVVITLAVAIATATISPAPSTWCGASFRPFAPSGWSSLRQPIRGPSNRRQGWPTDLARAGVSIPDLVDWSARANTFEAFAAFTFQSAVLTGLDVPSRISTVQATRNLLDVWGITPQIGRTFAADEATPGRERVVVVSHAFWQSQLSAAQDAVGKTLSIDGHPHTIVGVLPPDCQHGHFQNDRRRDADRARPRARHAATTAGCTSPAVLKPGIAIEQAEADLTAVARQLQTDFRSPTRKPASSCGRFSSCSARTSTPSCICSRLIAVIVFVHRLRERVEHHPRARQLAPARARRALGARRGTRCSRFGSS